MPLIKVDVFKKRKQEEIKKLLDIIHENVVKSFRVPENDRYQIVNTHEPYEMILKDTGLGFTRTDDVVVIQVISKKRSEEAKVSFYKNVFNDLHAQLDLRKEDLLISIVENTSADWSFKAGEAQFLTGEL
ncbi:tautomerase family protein [Priestia endophytica]|uniref:tautomerase family protein n=1 Tax=Priestia endophytica TaxID=135735 RepID=UPI000DCA916F|nr:tautomerase family protein [Priestia endophytica]RAS71557.1 tautomerase family protein [Priestia endophytica]